MSRQNAFALVIGIGSYRDEAIRPLQYTNEDARAFAELLTDEGICGVPRENVRLLVDEQATLFAIKDSISGWLASQAGPESTAILFYAGHGDVEPDRTQASNDAIANYLLPWDTSPSNLFASALSKEEFQRLVRTVRAKRSVIFMDACHSGGVATAGSRKMSVGYSRDLYESLAEGAGSTVIAAAKPNQLSWEDESLGHGVFTYHLLEALRGRADTDGDGRITMTEVFDYLKREVPASARKFGGVEQTPVFKAEMSEDIVLTINPGRIRELETAERERRERERKRIREMRDQLYAFERENELPAAALNYANALIEKPSAARDDEERESMELLEAMLGGHVSASFFVRHCERVATGPDTPKPPPSNPPSPEPEPGPERPHPEPAVAAGGGVARAATAAPAAAEGVAREVNLLMTALSLLMPLVGVIGGAYFMAQRAPAKKKAGKRWLILGCVAFGFWFLLGACAAALGLMEGGLADPYYGY